MTAPERAHVLVSAISADTVDDLARELHWMADRLLRAQVSTGITGGPASGSIYSYKVTPEQTHDVYFADVDRWLRERRDSAR
jgi:hypothetical protein